MSEINESMSTETDIRTSRPPDRNRPMGRVTVAFCIGVAAIIGAGCSSSPTTASTTTTRPASSSTTSTAPPTPTTTPPHYEVRTGTVKGLGTVLVDGQGFTLYLFVPDKQGGVSTCYGECAVAWPPLVLPSGVTAPLAGPGVKTSLLGTTHRTDGSVQITYNKWPLYLWVSDSEPGQATGQGINSTGGLWYVLSPEGNEITTKMVAAP
jgi:predicted lipoprotein with Yx(FWY)xxD motif